MTDSGQSFLTEVSDSFAASQGLPAATEPYYHRFDWKP